MRKIKGGPCIPVYVVPLSELKENGGTRKVKAGASWPVWSCVDDTLLPDNALLVGGGNWLAVNIVDYLGVL